MSWFEEEVTVLPCSEEEYEAGKETRIFPLRLRVGEEYFLRRKNKLWPMEGSFATELLVVVIAVIAEEGQFQIKFQEPEMIPFGPLHDLLLADTEGWLYRRSISGEPMGYFRSESEESDLDHSTPDSWSKRRPLAVA